MSRCRRVEWTTGYKSTDPSKPIRNPPMCAKLSIPGARPIARPITISTMRPMSLRAGLYSIFQWASRSLSGVTSDQYIKQNKHSTSTETDTSSAACVPKMAPDAPTDGCPTKAKLAPSTLPNIPAAKYTRMNLGVPMRRSTWLCTWVNGALCLWCSLHAP